jgi:ferredoxin
MEYVIAFDNRATFRCATNCSVSRAMKRAGVRMTLIGCRGGGCGVCRVQIIDGKYRTVRMSREHVSEEEEIMGYALGCCLYPQSDLILRAAPKSNLQTRRGVD